jgi:hypothetical protein
VSNIIPSFNRTTGNCWSSYGVANGSGSAGATVSVNVLCQDSVLPASGQYFVDVEFAADYTVFISAKTASGFTVNIQPRLAANSVAAGVFNCQCTW